MIFCWTPSCDSSAPAWSNFARTLKLSLHLFTPLAGTAIEFSARQKYSPNLPSRMSRKTARLFRQDLAAISEGFSSCSTVTREWIKPISSQRDLCASAASSCSYDLPLKFICFGRSLAFPLLFARKKTAHKGIDRRTRISVTAAQDVDSGNPSNTRIRLDTDGRFAPELLRARDYGRNRLHVELFRSAQAYGDQCPGAIFRFQEAP